MSIFNTVAHKVVPMNHGDAEVEDMLRKIDSDINRLQDVTDSELDSMFAKQGAIKPAINNDRSKDSDVNMKEEVKFSHELLEPPDKVADELQLQFAQMSGQLNTYKTKYDELLAKLKESEAKLTEAENKMDALEDENAKLSSDLRGALKNSTTRSTIIKTKGDANEAAELQKRSEEIRKALLSENDDEMTVSLQSLKTVNIFAVLHSWILRSLPFKRDIRQIQARFGSSVMSYFVFQRYLFLQMCGLSVITAVFVIMHVGKLSQRTQSLSEFMSGVGFLPNFMNMSSFHPSEGFDYSLLVVLLLLLLFVTLYHKLIAEDKMVKNVAAIEETDNLPYAKEIFCAWNNSLTNKTEIEDLRGNIGNTLLQMLEDTHTKGIKQARSTYESIRIHFRRAVGFLLYLYVLGMSFGAIIYVSVKNVEVSKFASSASGLNNLGSIAVTVILTVINSIVPILLQYITKLEQWDSAQIENNTMLFRVYVSNSLNSVILALGYLSLADPFLLATSPDLRNNLVQKKDERYYCLYDQVADGLFTLVLFTWGLKMVSMLAMPLGMKLLSDFRKQPWVKTEFNVADNMVKMLNFQGLMFMMLPFAPLATVFMPFFLLLNFKWEKNVIKHYYAKPQRAGKGQKSGLVYTSFYLITYVLLGLSMGAYFLTTKSFVKNCDVQDEFVGLCASSLSADNTCVTDPSSDYHAYYGTELDEVSDYPAVICNRACGPFVDAPSNVHPFKERLLDFDVAYVIWETLFSYPYVPWLLVAVLALVVSTKANSLDVSKLVSFQRERALETQIQAIELERRRQEKVIKKLKTIESAATADNVQQMDEC